MAAPSGPARCSVLLLFGLTLNVGCASTVRRLDGEFVTPAGRPSSSCEREEWLVVAPTRAELFNVNTKQPSTRDDGVGLYHVGASEPEALPELAPSMSPDRARFQRHAELVRAHDQRQLIAGGLGIVGVVAVTVGALVFVRSFDSDRKTNEFGTEDEQHVDTTEAVLGGVIAGVGFGLGATGIVLTPSYSQRAQAEADRYVLLPPDDRREDVLGTVGRYNQRVRERCVRSPSR